MLRILKPYADLLAIIGALTLFFSWIVKSTIQERLTSQKQAVDRIDFERILFQRIAGAQTASLLTLDRVVRIKGTMSSMNDTEADAYQATDEGFSALTSQLSIFDYLSD